MVDKQLTWQRYLLVAKFHWRFITVCAVGGLIMGVIMNLLILHPVYTSNGKLLIKGGKGPTFVTTLENDEEVHALTQNGNPLLTQIEVLNSYQLAQKVLDELNNTLPKKQYLKYQKDYDSYFEPEKLMKKLKLKNPANTDIITLKIGSPNKAFSQKMLDTYIYSYKDFLQKINHQTLAQQGQYIHNQITTAENKLRQVRDQLMRYRLANNTIDLNNEAEANIQQATNLEAQRIALEGQISSKRGNIANLKYSLGMSSRQGIQSVALGMNTAVTDTQKALNAALQDYQSLAVKYTDDNPAVQVVQAKIKEIQRQLTTEIQRTLGNAHNRRTGNHTQIADPVRSNLVNNLAAAESDLQGLQAEHSALLADINQLKIQTKLFPNKQLHISQLQDSEKVLSDEVNMLKLKATEADLQASDSLSNVVVVQDATPPKKPDFPSPNMVLVLMSMVGLLGGFGWLLAMEWYRMQTLKPIEQQLGNPIGSQDSIYSS